MNEEFIKALYKKYEKVDKEIHEMSEYLDKEDKDAIEALNGRGLKIVSIWDLRNKLPWNVIEPHKDYIINVLEKGMHPRNMMGLIRSFSNKKIKKDVELYNYFSKLYLKIPPDETLSNPLCRGVGQTIANVLIVHLTVDNIKTHIELIGNKKLGKSNFILIYGLKKYTKQENVKDFFLSIKEESMYYDYAKKTIDRLKKN